MKRCCVAGMITVLVVSICIGVAIFQHKNSSEEYEIYYLKYKDGIATNKQITYPQIKGLKNEEIERAANALIYEAATSSDVFENGDYQQDITCEVK